MAQLRIALRSVKWNEFEPRFVSADHNIEDAHLVANRTEARSWELFDVFMVAADGTLVPLELPAPGPTPPPNGGTHPPSTGGDMLDLSTITIESSPRDIATWPITRHIKTLTMRPRGVANDGLIFEFDQALSESWKWPSNPDNPSDNYQYTVWAIALGSGAAFIQMWQGRVATGAPILAQFHSDWAYDGNIWPKLHAYMPKAGDQMAFFVSAGDGRLRDAPTSVRERSNVVVVTLPAGDSGTFTF